MNAAPPAPLVTVVIPTFNRNEMLLRSVKLLLPQLRQEVQLAVRDNASPVPASETLRPALLSVPAGQMVVSRNPTNIGGNANVLRCIEECETEWIWILGDDDTPEPDAIDRILSEIRLADDRLVYVNYRSELFDRTKPVELHTAADLFERTDSISNALFLSASIFRTPAIKKHLRLAHAYSYSNMPHLIAVYLALAEGGIARLSTEKIASWQVPEFRDAWSVVNGALAFPTLLDLPLGTKDRIALGRRLEEDIHPELLGLARQVLMVARADGDTRNARWIWHQIRTRRYGGLPYTGRKLLAWSLGWLFLAPRLSHPIVELFARIILKDMARRNVVQDRIARI
jgi:hypothetical protein